jgi:hypothetical protein
MLKIMTILSLLISFQPKLRANQLYQIEDLQQLAKKAQWLELLNHAHDIRPSLRDENWQRIITQAAMELAKESRILGPFNAERFNYLISLNKFDEVATDEFFRIYLSDYAEKYLPQCLLEPESCLKSMRSYWDNGGQNPELGVKLAHGFYNQFVNAPNLNHSIEQIVDYWRFLLPSLSAINAKKTCSDVNSLNILKLIMRQATSNSSFPVKIETIKSNLNRDCLNIIKDRFMVYLNATQFDLAFGHYQLLKSFDLTSIEDDYFMLTRYFLNRPKKSDTFNMAWSALIKLSTSSEQRLRVLDRLKNLDPLPDEFLKQDNKLILFKHLNQYFPEYIDLYAQSCLNYLEGKKEFTRGNPTINCSRLMEEKNLANLLVPTKIERYNKIKARLTL